jgi:hypothetical protein
MTATGTNSGRPKRNVFVTRSRRHGPRWADYGAISFDFTPLTDGGPFVLFRIVSQRGAAGSLPTGKRTGGGSRGLRRERRLSTERARRGWGLPRVRRLLRDLCARTANGDSRALRYELAVGRQEAP